MTDLHTALNNIVQVHKQMMLGFRFPLKCQDWKGQFSIALSPVKHIHNLVFRIFQVLNGGVITQPLILKKCIVRYKAL